MFPNRAGPPAGSCAGPIVSAAIVAQVEALRGVCDDHGVPLAAAAIRVPLRHPAVTCVVIGARSRDQLERNIDWFDTELPERPGSDLDAALAAAQY